MHPYEDKGEDENQDRRPYQYFGFVTVDHALTPPQYLELVRLAAPPIRPAPAAIQKNTTPPRITPTRFEHRDETGRVHYPAQDWMQRFFDAHIHISQSEDRRRLLLRLPHTTLTQSALTSFTRTYPQGMLSACLDDDSVPAAFEATATPTHWILCWSYHLFHDIDWYDFDGDGPGLMEQLLPLRDELLRGDTRSLYMGWLAHNALCLYDERTEPHGLEPLASHPLLPLTPAQRALVEFLDIDQDWLAAAAEASPVRRTVTQLEARSRQLRREREAHERLTSGVGAAERRAWQIIKANRQKDGAEDD